jgi:predicted phosphoribosyltransferase
MDISEAMIKSISILEKRRIQKDELKLRGDGKVVQIKDRDILIVDDGDIAPRMLRASVEAVKKKAPRHIALALPAVNSGHEEVARKNNLTLYTLCPPSFPPFKRGERGERGS